MERNESQDQTEIQTVRKLSRCFIDISFNIIPRL
jgi:hypothetical protein